jgi:transglutaminase-like putative cysteine protease
VAAGERSSPGGWSGRRLFVALPRLRDAGTDGAASLTGFEREVDLDDVVALLDDPTVVAWVLAQSVGGGQVEGPLYLRGLALDSFDGRRWSASSPPSPVDPPSAPIPAEAIVVEVLREPLVGGVMPVPGQVAILRAPGTELSVDEGGAWYGGEGRQLRYALVAGPPLRPEERGAAGTWPPSALGLPALDARVVEIAAALDGQTPAELAAAAVERVGQQGYARRVVPRAGDDPLAAFLAEGAEGHCELFASSVAVLLRARGVPARVINGFAVGRVGEPLPSGVFPMRRSHAHAWVEAWIDGAWVLLDATPPGGEGPAVAWSPPTVVDRAAGWWRSSVVGYDHRVQVDAARTVARWVGATLPVVGRDAVSAERIGLVLLGLSALAALGLAVALARRLLRRLDGGRPANPGGAVAHAHARARAHLARQGVHPPLCLPPVAAAEWVAARGDPRGEDLVALAWLHYRVRYGGEPDAALLPAARELVARLTG